MTLRAGATATGLCLGGLGIAAAVAVVTAPITPRLAVAQTIDKPLPSSNASTRAIVVVSREREADPVE